MSRKRRNIIFATTLLLFAILVFFDHNSLTASRQNTPKTNKELNAHDLKKYHSKIFKVINVVDGDTIDIDSPDGKFSHTRIRLWGVDTPETKHSNRGRMYFGQEASDFTEKLTLGKNVQIYLDETRYSRDKYNRLLAYVKLPNGKFLNEVLLTEGFAYADLRFRHSFYNKYKQLEAVARTQKKGLWKKVTREQLPNWLRRENPNLLLEK